MTMEVDTGAALSLISEMMFKELWLDRSVSATTAILCSYSGEAIPTLGSIDTEVQGSKGMFNSCSERDRS